jgi:hypothetical protein
VSISINVRHVAGWAVTRDGDKGVRLDAYQGGATAIVVEHALAATDGFTRVSLQRPAVAARSMTLQAGKWTTIATAPLTARRTAVGQKNAAVAYELWQF